MAIAFRKTFWKAVGVVFTGVVAPLTVKMLDGGWTESTSTLPDPVTVSVPVEAASEHAPSMIRFVAKGTGATLEAAFQNAVDAALQQSVATEVTVAEWGRKRPQYLASLRQNGGGVLRGWRELSTATERHLTGCVYKSEVAVDVDPLALREKLHPTTKMAVANPPARLGLATAAGEPAAPNQGRVNPYNPVVQAGFPRDGGQR